MNLTLFYKSLADETRLRIIRILLNGTFHVNEIKFILNCKQSNISHHLKILQDSNIVAKKREGSLIYYRINEDENQEHIKNILHINKKEEKNIQKFEEDFKRLELILNKRKKSAEKFFNSIGSEFDNLQDKLFQNIYSVNDALKLLASRLEVIVDIGCGTGKNLPLLAEHADQVIGFDSSPLMLQLAEHICKKNNLNYDIKLGDIHKLPFNDSSLSGVFINMVLHHISDPFSGIKEISRILDTKGQLLLIELLSHDNEEMREKHADLWLGFSQNDLTNWLTKNNFSIKDKVIKDSKGVIKKSSSFKVIIILAEKNSPANAA